VQRVRGEITEDTAGTSLEQRAGMRTLLLTLLLTSCSTLVTSSNDPASTSRPLSAFSKTGGSVLTFFSVGPDWDNDVKGMIAFYHLDPAGVRARLAAMRANGQRRVGFVLWYVAPGDFSDISHAHVVVPRADNSLAPQHQQNLINFLKDIDAAGFEEVQIRFGAQGGAEFQCYQNPSCYSNPGSFDTPHLGEAIAFNWSFISQVVAVAEASGATTPRLYDIAPEYAGHPFMVTQPNWYTYTSSIWSHYVSELQPTGVRATLSFNHADPSGSDKTLAMYDQLGWPGVVSIDVYDSIHDNLVNLATALGHHGHGALPVFIQETWLDDPQTASEIRSAVHDSTLNLTHVMQWPQRRGSDQPVLDVSPYEQYLNLGAGLPPPPTASGHITASAATCTIPTGATTCALNISWSTQGAGQVEVHVGAQLFASGPSGTQGAPWIQAAPVRFDLLADGAIIDSVTVSGIPASAPPPPPPPPSGHGTISANPAVCTIPAGAATCTTTLSWSTDPGVSNVQVKIDGLLFASGPSGSSPAPWIQASVATFELWGDGQLLATAGAQGQAAAPGSIATGAAGLISADPGVCSIPSGGSLCTSTLTWSVPGASTVEVHIGGQLFARTAAAGSSTAPWISTAPALFELWADGVKVDSVTAIGEP
jgi:hypothetical protein